MWRKIKFRAQIFVTDVILKFMAKSVGERSYDIAKNRNGKQ
jgi:hypothetical protein